MSFNSFYKTIFKASPNDTNFSLNQLSKKNLPDFFIKIISKSKSQKEINNNNKSNNTIKKNSNLKKNITSFNNINKNNTNINKINKNIIIKKDDTFQQKKLERLIKRKFSESSILDIRKNKIKKDEEYHSENFEKIIKYDKDKKDNTKLTNIKNLSKLKTHFNNNTHINNNNTNINNNNNNNNNISPKNKTLYKFPNLTKSRRPLKFNDKKRYQKKFKENYAKLRNFLNHLFFMKKKYKFYNTLSPNLILGNTKNNFSPKLKEQINELMSKFNFSNELDENAVNLYIVNISSPINNFQKDILSLSRNVFYNKFDLNKKNNYKCKNNISHSSHSFHINESKDKKSMITPLKMKTKNIKYDTIIKSKINKTKFINNIKKYNHINQKKTIDFEIPIEKRNRKFNFTIIKSKSTNHIQYLKYIKNRIKQYNLLTKEINKTRKGIKSYPLIRIENFFEKYSNEEEIEKYLSNKMIEIYFNLSKNINLKMNNTFLNKDKYYYRLNKMYYEQLSLYMTHRINWELIEKNIDDSDYLYDEQKVTANFEWKYYSNRLYYKKYKFNSSYPIKKLCVINLFEKNYEIGNKKKMFIHLINFCDKMNLNVFNYVPLTIIINNTRYIEDELESFRQIYDFIECQKIKNENNINNDSNIIINKKYNEQFWFDDKIESLKKQYIFINKNFLSNKNYWILKPTDLYQGKCIEISNSFEEIYKMCKNIFRGVDKRIKPQLEEDETDNNNNNKNYTYNNNNEILNSSIDEQYDENIEIKKKKKISNIYISNELIIQKYLDNPLLYRKRKFDIRCFVLVDWNLNVFFCREGHLKASSFIYDINNINKFIHITNHSFQKKSNKFEQFEYGNEISYNEFKNFLKEEGVPLENFDKIIKKMKFLVKLSFKAVGEKLIKTPNVLSFELFGYDFIIDNEFNPWILEINNNPGLSISSPVIEKIIPRMMDDAFRLTIDKIFNTFYSLDCFDKNGNYKSRYKLDGYNDNENIFEFLCNVRDSVL